MNEEYDLEGSLSGMNEGGDDVAGAAPPPAPGMGGSTTAQLPGLASADPRSALLAAKERMEQLTKLKEQMRKQAQVRQAAMEQLAQAYSAPVDNGGMDPGLIALGKGIASAPAGQALSGFTSGMQGMQEARQKLAERDWARKAAAQKIRAEAEQQKMVDVMNEGKLDASMMGGGRRGGAHITEHTDANGNRIQVATDPYTNERVETNLGKVQARGAAAKLPTGMRWVEGKEGQEAEPIPGVSSKGGAKLPSGYMWGDNSQTSMVPVPGGPKDTQSAGTSVGGKTLGSWTDDALQEAAVRYANGDTTATQNMGVGKDMNPIKAEIRNRAAAIHKEAGVSPSDATDYAQQQRAVAGALLQITKQKTAVGAFERTALNNAELALKASSQVDRTGIPIFNKWLQAGRVATGSSEASKFHAANETFVNEYAKVMSGGTGAAATTDSALEHARTLLNTAMTSDQYSSVVGQLKTEMSSRMNAFDQETGHLRASRPGTKSSTPPANSKGWELHTDGKGRKAYVSPDGKQYEVVE